MASKQRDCNRGSVMRLHFPFRLIVTTVRDISSNIVNDDDADDDDKGNGIIDLKRRV